MNKSATIFFCLSLFLTCPAWADAAAEKEAEALLDATNMSAVLEQTVTTTVNQLIQSQPALAQKRTVLVQFFKKTLDYEVLKPEIVKIYARYYTAQELREIAAFYRTPVGQKSLRLMPQLMGDSMLLSQRRVQAALPELQKELQKK